MKRFLEFIKEALMPVHGTQYGSNAGGVHVDDESGEKFYVKHYKNPDQAKAEVLAGKIYKHMGIHTLEPEMHGESSVKTKWNDDVKVQHQKEYDKPSKEHANQLGKIYHASILTKNWDMVGPDAGNIALDRKSNKIISLDHGGAFHFRAQGGHKDYDHNIEEKDSMLSTPGASSTILKKALSVPGVEQSSISSVKKMDLGHVHNLFRDSGLSDWQKHFEAFKSRHTKLIDFYKK